MNAGMRAAVLAAFCGLCAPLLAVADFAGELEIISKPEQVKPVTPRLDEAAREYLAARSRLAETGGGWQAIDDLDRPFGFASQDPYHGPPGESPDALFRHVYPDPPIRLVRPGAQSDPLSGPHPGILAVEAWTMRWPAAPRQEQGVGGKRVTMWRWEAPKAWQGEWPFLARFIYRDRFAALGIVPRRWIGGKETASSRDPAVFCFDSRSGLVWQANLPIRAAVAEYASRTGAAADLTSNGAGAAAIKLAVSGDGSRVWVAAFWAKPYLTALYVFAADGSLLRTVLLPDRMPVGSILRAPTAARLLLNVEWRAPQRVKEAMGYGSPVDESYVLDFQGTPIGRLVDGRGLPVAAERVSDTHVLARQLQADGGYRRFLYALP